MAILEKVTNWVVAVDRVGVVDFMAHKGRVEPGCVGKRGIHAACVFAFAFGLGLAWPLALAGGLGLRWLVGCTAAAGLSKC